MHKSSLYLLFGMLLTSVHAVALDTDHFSIDLGPSGKLMRENVGDQERQYTLADPDSKILVLVKVMDFRKAKDAMQFRDKLIGAMRKDVTRRGAKGITELDDQQSRCDQHSIAYFKAKHKSTNVDFYMLCKRQVVIANYALQGTDASNIDTARATQKTFKLR